MLHKNRILRCNGYRLTVFLLLFFSAAAFSSTNQPLTVEKAFVFSSQLSSPTNLALQWDIASGYYLYRDRFEIKSDQMPLGKIHFPPPITKKDEALGTYQVYKNHVNIVVPFLKKVLGQQKLLVTYQGCAEDGFCYPPVTQQLTLNLTGDIQTSSIKITLQNGLVPSKETHAEILPNDKASQLLASHNIFLIVVGFFGLGLLLAFTPCVLPMIPILSSIIVGQRQTLTTWKAFYLSLTYVISMASTYAIAGTLAATAGNHLQSTLQKPWVLILSSLVFIALALSLFDVYELRLPAKLLEKLTKISHKQRGGTYWGVAVMGMISALIVSPCVSAPLAGALLYIAQTGDIILGSSALLALGLGMGAPLLLIGTTGGKFLPKAGPWMTMIKNLFGVLLLAVAIMLLERILPGVVILLLWASLLIIPAIYMGALDPVSSENPWQKFWKGLGFILLTYGVILLIGAALGNHDPLRPLGNLSLSSENQLPTLLPQFKPVKTREDLDRILTSASGKIAMLDFYADWCVSCKKMERYTFSDPNVASLLKNMMLLRADVTANDAQDKALLQRFNVIAPPAILFFGPDGKELTSFRINGEMDANEFLEHLQRL